MIQKAIDAVRPATMGRADDPAPVNDLLNEYGIDEEEIRAAIRLEIKKFFEGDPTILTRLTPPMLMYAWAIHWFLIGHTHALELARREALRQLTNLETQSPDADEAQLLKDQTERS